MFRLSIKAFLSLVWGSFSNTNLTLTLERTWSQWKIEKQREKIECRNVKNCWGIVPEQMKIDWNVIFPLAFFFHFRFCFGLFRAPNGNIRAMARALQLHFLRKLKILVTSKETKNQDLPLAFRPTRIWNNFFFLLSFLLFATCCEKLSRLFKKLVAT